MITLSNDILSLTIAEKGAELQSVKNAPTGLEYIWEGDPAFWGKHSPVLFPIVGGLKDNEYEYAGRKYSLGRHGFARDTVFTVVDHTGTSAVFAISETEETLQNYPFPFQFFVQYVLENDTLSVRYKVKNTGQGEMFFSVGAHPAFKVPLEAGEDFEDYYLRFNAVENAGIYPLDANGQVESQSVPFLENTDILPLKKELFYKDALVFKGLQSTAISIESKKSDHGLTVSFAGFPYMGIWSAKDADFVCIEPWDGIADSVHTAGKLEAKEGIIPLEPAQYFDAEWSVRFY